MTRTECDIRRLRAVCVVVNWSNLNKLHNACIIIHPNTSISSTRGTFIHTHNNWTGNVLTTLTLTSKTVSVWHYVTRYWYLCVPFPNNNTDYIYNQWTYTQLNTQLNNKRQIFMTITTTMTTTELEVAEVINFCCKVLDQTDI